MRYPRPVLVIYADKLGVWWRTFWLVGPNGITDGRSEGSRRPVTMQAVRHRQMQFEVEHPNGVTHDLTGRVFADGGRRGAA